MVVLTRCVLFQIKLETSEPEGTVTIDDQPAGTLNQGAWSGTYPLKNADEQHVLSVKNNSGVQVLNVTYTMAAGKLAIVSPLQTKDLDAASSLGKNAVVYSANAGGKLSLPSQPLRLISAEGLPVDIDDATDTFSVVTGKQTAVLPVKSSNAPTLSISLETTAPGTSPRVPVTVSATPKNANIRLYADNGLVPARTPGFWSWRVNPGSYNAKLTADGMQDVPFKIDIKNGKPFKHTFDLHSAGPPPASLTISTSTPGAKVKVDDNEIGALDERGMGTFSAHRSRHPLRHAQQRWFSIANELRPSLQSGKQRIERHQAASSHGLRATFR